MPLAEPERLFLERRLATSRKTLGDALAETEDSGRALDVRTALEAASRLRPR